MEIKTSRENNKAVVAPVGNMDTNTSDEILSALSTAFGQCPAVVLDMREIDYTSSAGLRVVLACHKQAVKQGGQFEIRNPNPQADELFEMTNFKSFLSIV